MAQTAKTCVECQACKMLISCPFIWLCEDLCSFNCFCVALNNEQHLGEAFYALIQSPIREIQMCLSYIRQHSRGQINITWLEATLFTHQEVAQWCSNCCGWWINSVFEISSNWYLNNNYVRMWWEQVRLNSLLSCLHIKHKCTLWAPLEEHGWDSCMSAPFVQTSFWEFFLCHLKLPVLLPKAALSCHTQFLTKSCMFRQLWNPRCVWFHRCLHLFIPFQWLCDCLLTDLTCFLHAITFLVQRDLCF